MSEGGEQTDSNVQSNLNSIGRNLDKLSGRSPEQHSFIDSMKYIHYSSFPSSSATKEALLEAFPPDALLHPSCLCTSLLYMNLREVLRMNGISVQRRQGLPVYQAIGSALYDDDRSLKSVADRMISGWRHARSLVASTAGTSSQHTEAQTNGGRPDTESTWRHVDAAERHSVRKVEIRQYFDCQETIPLMF